MASTRTEGFDSTGATRGFRRGTRHFGLVAAGMMAVAALGYTVVNAPGSAAQEAETKEAPNESCSKGTGSVTISKNGSGFKAVAEGKFPANCEGGGKGSATDISAALSEDGKSCVLTTKKIKGGGQEENDDNKDGEPDEFEVANGEVTATLKLDGKSGTVAATIKADDSGPSAEDIFKGTGKVQDHGVTSCDTVPTGDFTVTDISSSQSESPNEDK
ncbi:hypothetical protein [Nocardia iowensis]|uniref:Uncharacterized protein n=1 Tax=Nocardia iowensis TaxID=204891 RepID=A0ABX8RT83_NOCIO|nr:hypothetical protein [Nocardia iowensis]QXN92842.1 hypothetical protein KV110_06895 [Nocardia iowensis]